MSELVSNTNQLPKAVFSKCRKYRYLLTRQWDSTKPYVAFVGLNPSTADETLDDPTIRREINFSKEWGYGGLVKVNLFAFRATDPKDMKNALDPIGLENNDYLLYAGKQANLVVACWGNHGIYMGRGEQVKYMFEAYFGEMITLCHFGLTKSSQPKHPLYLKRDSKLLPFTYRSVVRSAR